MAIEIERKFLLKNNLWKNEVDRSTKFKQGYLTSEPECSVRIRVTNELAWLNIKSATIGAQRDEFEYPIPFEDGKHLLQQLCRKPLIEKIRHLVYYQGHCWEVDEFKGDNFGLIVAEIELSRPDESFSMPPPPWVGLEVTHDVRYYNNNLAQNPFSTW